MTDAGADAGAGGARASGPPAPHEAWETPWDAFLGIEVISPSELGIYPMISQEITIHDTLNHTSCGNLPMTANQKG